jgi:hypothetical protein
MSKKTRLRRPSKAMMLAVNAAIDRKDKEVDRLIKDHDLDSAELEQRLLLRQGKHYDVNGTKRKSAKESRQRAKSGGLHAMTSFDLNIAIDGRTSVAKLYKIISEAERLKVQAQQELKRRPDDEVEPVKQAFLEIELLRREQEKIQDKIKAAEESLS